MSDKIRGRLRKITKVYQPLKEIYGTYGFYYLGELVILTFEGEQYQILCPVCLGRIIHFFLWSAKCENGHGVNDGEVLKGELIR